MVSFKLFFLFSFIVIDYNEAARILAYFPVPSISHQVVFRPLVKELARRGHDVTVLTPDPVNDSSQKNLTEIDLHDISYDSWKENFAKLTQGKSDDAYSIVEFIYDLMSITTEKQLKTKEVENILNDKTKTFDLLMIEACVRPALVLSYLYPNVPVIHVSSFGGFADNYETMGIPTHPILYPKITRQRIYNLTMWEKVKELYSDVKLTKLLHDHENIENEMLRRNFGLDVPSVTELNNNVDMLFLNMYNLWEGNFPIPPSVIHTGGLHQKPLKEIPKDLKNYLDNSKNGVIYISFGTNVSPSQLPPERIQLLLKVFSQLPYNVLWKWDKDQLPGKTNNIKISKWLPQSDLLRHPNVKLFITQGGLQSTDEAITAGVPMIGMPMLGYQWFNVEKYVYYKIGLRLDMESLTEENFKSSIIEILENNLYRNNVIKLRNLMQDQPQSPLDRAVWWTEYVIRHKGAKHLRAPAANITWAQYLELELVAVFSLLIITFISIVVYIIRKIIRIVMSKNCKSKIKNN